MRRLGVRVPYGAPNKNRHPVGCLFLFFVIIIRDENPKGRGCEASQFCELTSKPRSKPTDWGGAGRQTCLTNGKAWAAKSLMAHQIKQTGHRPVCFIYVSCKDGRDSNPKGRERGGRQSGWTVEQRAAQADRLGRRRTADLRSESAGTLLHIACESANVLLLINVIEYSY